MGNYRRGNTWYIDTASAALETGANQRVVGIFVTPTSANGYIVLGETSSADTIKLRVGGATANSTVFIDLSDTPVVFSGIYVQTLTTAVATLILSDKGRG